MNGKIKHKATTMLYAVMTASLILAGCGGGGGGGGATGSNTIETGGTGSTGGTGGTGGTDGTGGETPGPTRNVKAIKLGEAEKFAILAYSSVTSVPNSSISGKIGLMPGTREAIAVDPAKEIAGGPDDMIGSDDETVPINFLTNAKLDMISAYNESAIRKVDDGKTGSFQGKIGGKVLPPGTYKWNSAVNIASDYTLEGSSNDVWIFQVAGELNVAQNVKMILAGGAHPQHIFWQVTGPVTLGANSFTAGTIIALPSITMKAGSTLKGRAFAKNGKVSLEQATIARP